MDKTFSNRNPLSICLGVYFSQERRKIAPHNKAKDIATELVMGESLYRMIESGNARIHAKYIPSFIRVFQASNIQLDPFCKLIVAIQFIDSYMEPTNFDYFTTAINTLKTIDSDYKILFNKIVPLMNQINYEDENFRDTFITRGVIDEISYYLSSVTYRSYSKSRVESQKELLNTFLNKIPSIHYHIVESFMTSLEYLPRSFRRYDLWKWEKSNNRKIEKLYALLFETDYIINEANLSAYPYSYIWEDTFKEGHLLCWSEKSSIELKTKFNNIIRKIAEKKFKENFKESEYQMVVDKFHFHIINDYETMTRILKLKDKWKIAWIFELNTGAKVGLRAQQEGSKFFDYISLNMEKTERLYEDLKSLILNN